MNYKNISKELSKTSNKKITTTTARKTLLKTMRKIARALCEHYGQSVNSSNINKIAESKIFQDAIEDISIQILPETNEIQKF